MKSSMKNIALIVLGLACLLPSFASANTFQDRQVVTISLSGTFTGEGTWEVPLGNTFNGNSNVVYVPEYKSYGTAASTQYTLTSVTRDAQYPVSFEQAQDEVMSFPLYTADRFYHYFKLKYKITPFFTQPVAVYEIWLLQGTMNQNPILNVTFPSGWKVLNASPTKAVVSGNSIALDGYTDTRPILLMFNTSGNGVIETVGKYTISGSAAEVQKIKAAIAKLDLVDSLLSSSMGLTLPQHIFIVSDDMTKSDAVGYEAQAIAGNPNFIVFNNRFAKNKSVNEVAEILAHELQHLAMRSQILFGDREFGAPWLMEGMAVYFETLAHKIIFTDVSEKVINEELDRTFTVSPDEASALYESPFDVSFDGTRDLGTGASYRHAGLLFARFADKAGAAGFQKLFAALKDMQPPTENNQVTEQILRTMGVVSGLTVDQLEFPGKSEKDVSGVVSRVSHATNDETQSTALVANYIQNGIKHYFNSSQINPVVTPVTSLSASTSPSASPSSKGKLTQDLKLGSQGTEVVILQTFLEARGFLKMPPGLARGSFGNATKNAVKAYQKSSGIPPTGSVGPRTRAAVNAAL